MPEQEHWYRPVNPKEHSYTPGYGFSPRSPNWVEQRQIAKAGGQVAVCLLGFLFLSAMLPSFGIGVMTQFVSADAPLWVQELIWEALLALTAVVALTVPFFWYGGIIKIPSHIALPMRAVSPFVLLCSIFAAFGIAVVGAHASIALEAVSNLVGIQFEQPMPAIPQTTGALIVWFLNMTLLPAVLEELAFRGYLLQSLRRFGDSFALLVSSLLFAMIHGHPLQIPNAFLMGLAIGYFTLLTGSLHTGMLIHFLHNAAMAGFSLLSLEYTALTDQLYPIYLLLSMVLALVGVILLLRRYPDLFALRCSRTITPYDQKFRSFFGTLPMIFLLIALVVQAYQVIL